MLNFAVAGDRTSKRRKSRSSLLEPSVSTRRSSEVNQVSTTVDYKSLPFDNFSHVIYEKAALVYVYLKGETDSSLPTFDDERVKRRAYSLAFGAKKCKQFLPFISILK